MLVYVLVIIEVVFVHFHFWRFSDVLYDLKTDALFVVATGTDKLCSCAFFTQYGSTAERIHYVTTKI